MKLSFCLSCFILVGICAILWFPALHYREALKILGLCFLVMGLLAGFFEKPPPKV